MGEKKPHLGTDIKLSMGVQLRDTTSVVQQCTRLRVGRSGPGKPVELVLVSHL
jgi:hypothetical protein